MTAVVVGVNATARRRSVAKPTSAAKRKKIRKKSHRGDRVGKKR